MADEVKVTTLMSDLQSSDRKTIQAAIQSFRELTDPVDKNKAFHELVELLTDVNPWFRLRAVYALGALSDHRAIEPLIETLDDDDDEAGLEMIEARFTVLSALKDSRAIKPLIEQLHRVDFKQAWDLYAFGEDALTPMIDALQHHRADTRWHAAYFLGNRRSSRAVLPLIELTNDPNQRVRVQAIYSLGWIGSSEVIPTLMRLSTETDSRIREAVAYALGKIDDVKALPILRQLAEDEIQKVKAAAVKSLGELNSNNHQSDFED